MATIKQKLVASKMMENGGSLGKAMREAGYSKAMAKNPQKLTSSKGWAELMDQYVPEKLLLQRHRQLLNKRVTYWAGDGDAKKLVRTSEIDSAAVARGVELGYKMRGKLTDKVEVTPNERMEDAINRINALLPDAEL